MDLATISNKTIISPFLDSLGQHALSIAYPVGKETRARFLAASQTRRGDWEAHLNFPCFQIYLASPHALLNDPSRRQQVKMLILRILLDFERVKFFKAFHGVRFEIYNGRPGFGHYLDAGRVSQSCIRLIADHAIQEREIRNTRLCFLNAVNRHRRQMRSERRLTMESRKVVVAEPGVLASKRQLLIGQICEIGKHLSSDIACFDQWRKNSESKIQGQPITRRKTIPEMDSSQELPAVGRYGLRRAASLPIYGSMPTSNSTSTFRQRSSSNGALRLRSSFLEHQRSPPDEESACFLPFGTAPALQNYMLERFAEAVKGQFAEFRAPLVPNSFYDPPKCQWHNLVIILHRQDLTESPLHLLRFGRELTLDACSDERSFAPNAIDCSLQQVSIGRRVGVAARYQNVAVVLGRHLSSLGMTKPSFVTRHSGSALDEVLHSWFPTEETQRPRDRQDEEDVIGQELTYLGYNPDKQRSVELDTIDDSMMHTEDASNISSPLTSTSGDFEVGLDNTDHAKSTESSNTYCLPEETHTETAELVVHA